MDKEKHIFQLNPKMSLGTTAEQKVNNIRKIAECPFGNWVLVAIIPSYAIIAINKVF